MMPRLAVVEDRCLNGWGPADFHPWSGGHMCERKENHGGRCRCSCGVTTTKIPVFRTTVENSGGVSTYV
jgi:hypothetical protein